LVREFLPRSIDLLDISIQLFLHLQGSVPSLFLCSRNLHYNFYLQEVHMNHNIVQVDILEGQMILMGNNIEEGKCFMSNLLSLMDSNILVGNLAVF
jgi:hypothetical protein